MNDFAVLSSPNWKDRIRTLKDEFFVSYLWNSSSFMSIYLRLMQELKQFRHLQSSCRSYQLFQRNGQIVKKKNDHDFHAWKQFNEY